MTLKLLADPLFPESVIEELERAGMDAVHAGEIGAGDLPLREIMRLAVFENRIVVTHNRGLARLIEASADPRPSLIFLENLKGSSEAMSHLLLNLLSLFNGDLVEGAMVIVREGQTLLRRFPHL